MSSYFCLQVYYSILWKRDVFLHHLTLDMFLVLNLHPKNVSLVQKHHFEIKIIISHHVPRAPYSILYCNIILPQFLVSPNSDILSVYIVELETIRKHAGQCVCCTLQSIHLKFSAGRYTVFYDIPVLMHEKVCFLLYFL